MELLDAVKYTKIETEKGAIAALTQFVKDINLGEHSILIKPQSRDGYFGACVTGINIGGDEYVRSFLSRSGPSEEKAAAALLNEFLNPKTATGEGRPFLEAAGTKYLVRPDPQAQKQAQKQLLALTA